MKVGELAKLAGVTGDTVRHYTRIGLLRPKRNPDNGYQYYDDIALKHLRFSQKARLLGFSLNDIQTIVHHEHNGASPCPMVRDLMGNQFTKVVKQIKELEEQLARMESAMDAWKEMPDAAPGDHSICPLIEHWNNQEGSKDER